MSILSDTIAAWDLPYPFSAIDMEEISLPLIWHNVYEQLGGKDFSLTEKRKNNFPIHF